MPEKLFPNQYFLEVYENSFANDACYYVSSTSPFGAISIGDYFNDQVCDTWYDPPEMGKEKFVVRKIEHIVWTIEGSHNAHKIMIALKKEQYDTFD
jgi:hypothetical protein